MYYAFFNSNNPSSVIVLFHSIYNCSMFVMCFNPSLVISPLDKCKILIDYGKFYKPTSVIWKLFSMHKVWIFWNSDKHSSFISSSYCKIKTRTSDKYYACFGSNYENWKYNVWIPCKHLYSSSSNPSVVISNECVPYK